ncbi:MAG: tRNA threonylcarbamoyladenosine dehydratase [Ruminococcus sp.]|nr:tRNA threonylcarbamoyladenosine dehydratase [Ruminococcus sp.]
MRPEFSRTQMLIGDNAMKRLEDSSVIVFGVGGVGSYVVEALARSGVGKLTLVDADKVDITNINRQIIALSSTVGRYKAEVAKERIADINPDCEVTAVNEFYSEENTAGINLSDYDYVVDAIDSVRSKVFLIKSAYEKGVRVISSMGAGNKLDPTKFRVADINKTEVCPLARVMRRELRLAGVKKLKCVYSTEVAAETSAAENGKRLPASIAFVPSAAGLIIAGEVIKDLIKDEETD